MDELFVTYKGRQVVAIPNVSTRLQQFEKNFTSREDDIWICAYPKSGTHWVNEIVRMIRYDTLEKGISKEKFFVEMTSHEEWESIESPRVFNTHLPPPILPESVFKNKILFIVRNLKDVYVSHYHDYLSILGENEPMSWDQYFDVMIENLETFHYHHEWIKAANANQETILVVNYERIKENPVQNISRIANFLGMEKQAEFYDNIATATGIDAMKATYKNDMVQLENSDVKWSIGQVYRKGVVGDWKNWFTQEQCKRFDEVYKREMDGLILGNEKYMDL